MVEKEGSKKWLVLLVVLVVVSLVVDLISLSVLYNISNSFVSLGGELGSESPTPKPVDRNCLKSACDMCDSACMYDTNENPDPYCQQCINYCGAKYKCGGVQITCPTRCARGLLVNNCCRKY